MILNSNFEKASLGFFPYKAYVSHKNDSSNLTKKSIKGLVVNLSILYFLIVSIHGRPQVLSLLFFGNLPAMFWFVWLPSANFFYLVAKSRDFQPYQFPPPFPFIIAASYN